VVYGHIHQSLDFEHLGIRCFCSPSTCIQFKPHTTSFALDALNPGYRSFTLYENGTIESDVKRIQDSDLDVDYESSGY
jgi:Icc protein